MLKNRIFVTDIKHIRRGAQYRARKTYLPAYGQIVEVRQNGYVPVQNDNLYFVRGYESSVCRKPHIRR